MKALIIVLLVAILVIGIYNLFLNYRIKIICKDSNSAIKGEGYFDLKYRIQLYVYVITIIVATGAFIGYDTYSNIKTNLSNDIEKELASYDTNFARVESFIYETQSFLDNFNIEKEAISSTLLKSGNKAEEIEKSINILASRRINEPNIYWQAK